MRFLRHLFLLSLLIGSPFALSDDRLDLTPAQQAELESFAPGVELTPALAEKLRAIAFDQNRSLDDRIKAKGGTGDLRAKVQVVVPQRLSDEAREAVETLRAEESGTDPRADLMRRAQG